MEVEVTVEILKTCVNYFFFFFFWKRTGLKQQRESTAFTFRLFVPSTIENSIYHHR